MKMKKLIILSFLVLLSFSPFAQNKFGYIDKQEVFFLTPSPKSLNDSVSAAAFSGRRLT